MATLTLNETEGQQALADFLTKIHHEALDMESVLNGAIALLRDSSKPDPASALTTCQWVKERLAAHAERIEQACDCARDNQVGDEIRGDAQPSA